MLLGDIVKLNARKTPDRTALIVDDRETTYGQLYGRVQQLANALLGNPEYYGRFGFEASGPFGIVYEPVGEASPYFQVRRLAAFDTTISGTFR